MTKPTPRKSPSESEKYSYRVLWSEEDQEYVGLCAEFPSLSWLAEDQSTALEGIVRLVDEVSRDIQLAGMPTDT